jgi:hypothetical protein
MDEGGLVWMTPDRETAEFFAGEGGVVLEFKLEEPLRLLDRFGKVPDQLVADALNEALGLPDYKAARKGDSYNTIVLRAFMSSPDHLFDAYQTDGGTMKVIWPVVLKALFVDALLYNGDQIALPADTLQVRVANPRKFVTLDPNVSYPLEISNITKRGMTPKQALAEADRIIKAEKKRLKRLESMPETNFRFGLEDRIHERLNAAQKQRDAAKRAM